MAKNAKFYAVKRGRTTGIYGTWADCQAQVSNFPGAIYRGFKKLEDAKAFLKTEETCNQRPMTAADWQKVRADEYF